MDGQSREQSRDLALKGAKRSPLTKWKSWKSWAKVTKAVIGCPSECQKQRDFQGGLDVDEKGGGGRGGQKCRILGKYAVQSGQRRSVSSAFWSKSCEFRAHLSSFSSNPCSKAVQNDHIRQQKSRWRSPAAANLRRDASANEQVHVAAAIATRHPRGPAVGVVVVGATTHPAIAGRVGGADRPMWRRLREARTRSRCWCGRTDHTVPGRRRTHEPPASAPHRE